MQKLQLTEQQGMKYEMNGAQITGRCNGWFVHLGAGDNLSEATNQAGQLLLCF